MAERSETNPVAHLEYLERQGVVFSRNRFFDFFAQPANRRALRVLRRMQALARVLGRLHAAHMPDMSLETRAENGTVDLIVGIARLDGRHLWRLSPGELRVLARQPGMQRLLQSFHIDVDLTPRGAEPREPERA